jgi:hypothetical protein
MKRIFAALLCACFLAACTSPERMVEGYYEDLMDALEEHDFDKALDLSFEYKAWYDTLSESEQQEVNAADNLWQDNNKREIKKLDDLTEACFPEYLNTEQFIKWIQWIPGEMTTENYYHYGVWRYDDQSVSMVCAGGKYYIAFNDFSSYYARVVVPFENADKAVKWLDKTYSRLTDVRKQMNAAGVSSVNKKITIEVPDMLCLIETSGYRSCEVKPVSSARNSEISIDKNRSTGTDKIEINIDPYHSLTISDESYHAMKAALKSRDVMMKALKAYKELEDSIY